MAQKEINFAVAADFHMFHGRVTTPKIVKSLIIALPDNTSMDDIDFIYFPGDVFDKISDVPAADVGFVNAWISGLLDMCYDRNIKLRIVEGTPSHDRKQSRLFNDINEAKNDRKADLRYFNTLTIDYEEEYDFHTLYVPDEWHHDLDVVWEQVNELLRLNGIESVQTAIMHGMFGHQVPPDVPLRHHDAEKYLSIVDWFIGIGHIHSASTYKRIFAPGSIERLSMGEEEPKGHFRIKVTLDGYDFNLTSKFIVNHNACVQNTYDVRGMEFEESLLYLTERAIEQKTGFIRIHATWDLNKEGILQAASTRFPDIVWSKKIDKVELEVRAGSDGMFKLPTVEEIYPHTMHEQISKRIGDLEDPINKRALELLMEALNGRT